MSASANFSAIDLNHKSDFSSGILVSYWMFQKKNFSFLQLSIAKTNVTNMIHAVLSLSCLWPCFFFFIQVILREMEFKLGTSADIGKISTTRLEVGWSSIALVILTYL